MPDQIPRLGCGALIRRPGGAVLLVQRRRQPEAGHWGIPGGKVDWMEKVEDAVRREIAEETALDITLTRLLCVADHFEPDLGQHWVAPIWLAEASNPDAARLMEPQALAGLGWFEPHALPEPLTKVTLAALAALAAL